MALVAAFGALGAYVFWAVRVCSDRKEQVVVSEVRVRVLDADSLRLVTPEDVERWLEADSIAIYGVPVGDLDTGDVEDALRSRLFVRGARAYTDLDGTLHVEITQREPAVRVISRRGCDFYLSEDGMVLPSRGITPVYVPLVTGDFMLPFRGGFTGDLRRLSAFTKKHNQSYNYLLKLINFVGMLSSSPFWDAQVVQVEVVGSDSGASPQVELVTRVGGHRILLGSIDDPQLVAQKLDKLEMFYGEVLGRRGWDAYTTVELGNRGQIVCRRVR